MGGGASAPPVMDYRIERTVKQFLIPPEKITKLWNVFVRYDREGNKYITMDDYFERLIKFPRTGLTDAMFTLLDTKSDVSLTFGEFVEATATFCCFEKMELLKYFFYILDTQKSGLVEKNEVKHFVQMIWNHDYSSNVKEALEYLDEMDDGDGTFTFKEIMGLEAKYPNTFYPVYKLQVHIIQSSLGETWWENHKAHLIETKLARQAAEIATIKKRQAAAEAEEAAANDEVVLKRMGFFKYYCMPWLRAAERIKIARIAAIESEMEAFKDDKKNRGDEDGY